MLERLVDWLMFSRPKGLYIYMFRLIYQVGCFANKSGVLQRRQLCTSVDSFANKLAELQSGHLCKPANLLAKKLMKRKTALCKWQVATGHFTLSREE